MEKEERIIVDFKGTEYILQPGHKVFEIDIKTGIVKEAELISFRDLRFWRKQFLKKKYRTMDVVGKEYLPAYDIHKAKVRFQKLFGKILKVK